jgi:hypothetical protein
LASVRTYRAVCSVTISMIRLPCRFAFCPKLTSLLRNRERAIYQLRYDPFVELRARLVTNQTDNRSSS